MFPSVRKFSSPISVSGKIADCSVVKSEVRSLSFRMSMNLRRYVACPSRFRRTVRTSQASQAPVGRSHRLRVPPVEYPRGGEVVLAQEHLLVVHLDVPVVDVVLPVVEAERFGGSRRCRLVFLEGEVDPFFVVLFDAVVEYCRPRITLPRTGVAADEYRGVLDDAAV